MCSERALTLFILGISLGGWQDMYREWLVDSVVGSAWVSGGMPPSLRNKSFIKMSLCVQRVVI